MPLLPPLLCLYIMILFLASEGCKLLSLSMGALLEILEMHCSIQVIHTFYCAASYIENTFNILF